MDLFDGTQRTLTVKPGQTYSTPHSTVTYPKTVLGLDFELDLDESIIEDYRGATSPSGSPLQNNAQKLLGFSFGSIDPHANSFRLTYSLASKVNKKIYLRKYYYLNRKITNEKYPLSENKMVVPGILKGQMLFDIPRNVIVLSIPAQKINDTIPYKYPSFTRFIPLQLYIEPSPTHIVNVKYKVNLLTVSDLKKALK